MNKFTVPWKVTGTFCLALTALFVSGCATQPAQNLELSPTRSAGVFSKDTHVCFVNNSSEMPNLTWLSTGLDTYTGQGPMPQGQQGCAEGSAPQATVKFSDGFTTFVLASNVAIGYPEVGFRDKSTYQKGYKTFASSGYSIGETIGSDVEGHHFSVTRNEDSDFINFTIKILD